MRKPGAQEQSSDKIEIPIFNSHSNHPNTTPDRVIAAIRWDLEILKLPLGVVITRYSSLLGSGTVRDIAAKRIKPDVKPSKFKWTWQ